MNLARTRVTRTFLVGAGILSLLTAMSCNSGTGGGPGPIFGGETTPVTVMMADAGTDKIIEFHATVAAVQLVNSGSTPQSVSGTATVEVNHLAGAAQYVMQGAVPADIYTSANVTISNVALTFIDSTGAVKHASSTSSFTLNASIPSTTISSTPMVLLFEVPLASFVSIDASDVVTFNTSPSVTAALNPVNSTVSSQDLSDGLIANLDGAVVSVGSNSFVLSAEQIAANATVLTNSSTAFVGPAGATLSGGLTNLAAGKIVEVNAVTQSDGKLLATRVEVEENTTAGMEAEGIISGGALTLPTTFSITSTDPAAPGAIFPALGNALAVTTTTGAGATAYTFDQDVVNMTGLSFVFDATHLALGQNVEVDATTPSATAATADRVKLQEQTLTGTISGFGIVTGQFTVDLPAESYITGLTKSTALPSGITSINVYQTTSTLVDPSLALANGTVIRARGLLFWDGTQYQLVASGITPP